MAIHVYKVNGQRVDYGTYAAAKQQNYERRYLYPFALKYFQEHGFPPGIARTVDTSKYEHMDPVRKKIEMEWDKEARYNEIIGAIKQTKGYKEFLWKERKEKFGCALMIIAVIAVIIGVLWFIGFVVRLFA